MAWPIVSTGEQADPDKYRWARRLFPFALFLLALGPRLVAINRYITPDELLWVYRSIELREAIRDGRWSDTLVAGHPGVTTTWLGAAGISAQLAINGDSQADYDWLARMAALLPDNAAAFTKLSGFLTAGRISVAIINSLAVVLIFLLVKRLWGFGVAALAGALLALDPFAAGLSGLLHVDALSTSFATVALLALGIATTYSENDNSARPFLGMMALSGVAAGLALLTKTPMIVLGAVAALAFVVWYVFQGGPLLSAARRRLLWGMIVWGGTLAATMLLLLPALWSAPANVLATLSGNANRHLDEALRPTFFMGQVAFNHGALFYPVVLLWRNGPVVVAAAVPLVLLLLGRKHFGNRRIAGRDSYLPLFILVIWIVFFVGLISIAAKKFDRYALPVIPALIIVAALVWIVWQRRRHLQWSWLPWALVAVQTVYLLLFVGYPLAAYNPLVGGPFTAVKLLPMGWGEGISASGRYLTVTQAGIEEQTAMAGVVPSLAPFFAGRTLVEGRDPVEAARYIIRTLGGAQIDAAGDDPQSGGLELLETIRFGGLDQAWIYVNPNPTAVPAPPQLADPVRFGERMALTAAGTTYADDVAHIAVAWLREAPLARDERYQVRVVVRDEQGNVWASLETELLNSSYFYPADWEDDESGVVHYLLELTPAIPPGTYRVDMTVMDGRTGEQLPARSGGDFAGVVYPLGRIEVPRPSEVVSAARVQIPQTADQTWLNGSLQLLGTSVLPTRALAGSQMPLDLFWHTSDGGLPSGLEVQWWLVPADGAPPVAINLLPVSRLDTAEWRPGETVSEKIRLALPPAAVPGTYVLALALQDAAGLGIGPRTGVGTFTLDNIDRKYELPADLPLLPQVCFGAMLCLEGIAPSSSPLAPGEPTELTLYWQVQAVPDAVYTVFFHVVDAAGNIVHQADHWPGGLPTDILAQDQVITDRVLLEIPGDLATGTYDLRIGLYSAEDGQRLPVTSSTLPAGDDFLLVPDYFMVGGS